MKSFPLLTLSIFVAGCGTSDGYARPSAGSSSAGGIGGGQYRYSLEQRVAALEQDIRMLAARLCNVESKIDPVTFQILPNGGVIMQRSGQVPRLC